MAREGETWKAHGDGSGGYHLFPFRTEKLKPLAPMVLRLKRGRVGRRRPQGPGGIPGLFFCPGKGGRPGTPPGMSRRIFLRRAGAPSGFAADFAESFILNTVCHGFDTENRRGRTCHRGECVHRGERRDSGRPGGQGWMSRPAMMPWRTGRGPGRREVRGDEPAGPWESGTSPTSLLWYSA